MTSLYTSVDLSTYKLDAVYPLKYNAASIILICDTLKARH